MTEIADVSLFFDLQKLSLEKQNEDSFFQLQVI